MLRMFDLKTGEERDYRPQMAFYALGLMQRHGEDAVEVHEVYSRSRKAKVYEITREEAEGVVFPLHLAVKDKGKQPSSNEYCSWCANRATCPALAEKVKMLEDKLDFDLDTPSGMGGALCHAHDVIAWADGVKQRGKQMALNGVTPEGWTLVSMKNRNATYLRRSKKHAEHDV